MSETLDFDGLDQESQAALERLVLTLADTKRLMGIRYSDWTIGAPTIETGISAASMCQDEWGHARLLYAMFKRMGKDPGPYERDRAAEEYASVSALDDEATDWAAVVALMVLVDGALSAMLQAFAEGTFEPARKRVPKMLAEEEFHASLGAAWYRRLAASEGEARDLLTAATQRMLPDLLAWVGTDDEGYRRMTDAGVIEDAEARSSRFKDEVRSLTALVDVDIDAVAPTSEWDAARSRTPGRPNDEAVQRARGDLNRALFVE
ncbi:MAG: Phenylacetic acid catabolic protein [Gemmatimonadota bacterium]